MRLDLEQIRSVTQGAVKVEECGHQIVFHRYTPEQEALYRDAVFNVTLCPAGVRLEFQTDSSSLYLRVHTETGSSRRYFLFEILCNGKRIGTLGNIDGTTPLFDEQGNLLPSENFRLGTFEKSFTLGEGIKTLCVYFPWSVTATLEELRLDDGACFVPVKRQKRLLMFGDSITQGYDARYPSQSYAARLTDALGVEGVNKGYGGDVFRPELLQEREDFTPDYITVAYGTNDWNGQEKIKFEDKCTAFYNKLEAQYPQSKIYAITPTWRKDGQRITRLGRPEDVAAFIEKVTAPLPNVVCLHGDTFVPHDTALFADRRLHPNDEGFAHYFNALFSAWSKERK